MSAVDQRLTVLLLSDLFPPVLGGLERHVDELATLLTEAGHDVHVATCTQNPRSSSPRVTTHVVHTAVSRFVRYENPDRPFHPPAPDPKARRELRHIIDTVRPDVIHGHSLLAHSLPRQLDVPVVLTAHDYGLICQRRTLYDRHQNCCSGPRGPGCVSCGAEQYGWSKSLAGAVATSVSRRTLHADHIISVSEAVAESLRPWLPVPLSVIHNWTEQETSNGQASVPDDLPTDTFVLYAGDPGAHKGIDVLLDAWSGESAPKAELYLATTRELDRRLPPRVRTGRLAREEMSGAWRAASVAVVPSLWPEPCPLVALEAMRAGTPIVASAIGGLPELVRDGVDGILVPPGDAHALRSAVDRLLADEGLRRRLGSQGRTHAASFAPSLVIPRVVTVYRDAIAARGGA
jgi:glycosyltransferase involved in cell wall biosynthesis